MKKKVLVVPSGTEIGLEIERALRYSANYELIGTNSIDDSSSFLFNKNKLGLPYVDETEFSTFVIKLVDKLNIDFVIPAHDSATLALSYVKDQLGARLVCSDTKAVEIARSKLKTYEALKDAVRVPKVFHKGDHLYPVFIKPDVGQGSRGAFICHCPEDYKLINSGDIVCEYLPGEEYTVDCLNDKNGNLIYASPRIRLTMKNGISVSTRNIELTNEFKNFALSITQEIKLKGAWFFQVKRNVNNELCLLEISVRPAGSMALSRMNGVNFIEESLLIHQGVDVNLIQQNFKMRMDRPLNQYIKINIDFNTLYVGFDGCLLLDNKKLNSELIQLLVQVLNKGKEIILLTRHRGGLVKALHELRLSNFFDRVVHLDGDEPKSNHINKQCSIFIDDSFDERYEVYKNKGIPVFSLDAVSGLLHSL